MKTCIWGNTRLNYSWFVLTTRQGLQKLGHEVLEVDYRGTPFRNAVNQILEYKPDLLFTHLTFHNAHRLENVFDAYRQFRKIGIKVIHTLNDARNEPRYSGSLEGVIDHAFVSQTKNLQKFADMWKIPTHLWQYCTLEYDKIVDPVPELKFDLPVFPGSDAHKDRQEFLQLLRQIQPFHQIQTQSKQDLRHKTQELSASTPCILGFCTGYDIDHFIDVRPWQYLGAGACMIIRKFKKMDDIIPCDLYYPIQDYTKADAKIVKVHWNFIKNSDTSHMRKRAFDFMQKYHSSSRRIGDLIDVVFEKRERVRIFLDEI